MTDFLKVTAPFTPEQVASLNSYQVSGAFHEFTCGNDSYHDDDDEQSVLVAKEDGWHCPAAGCGYTQDWAHSAMADGSWRDWREVTVRVDDGPPIRGHLASRPG